MSVRPCRGRVCASLLPGLSSVVPDWRRASVPANSWLGPPELPADVPGSEGIRGQSKNRVYLGQSLYNPRVKENTRHCPLEFAPLPVLFPPSSGYIPRTFFQHHLLFDHHPGKNGELS